MHLLPTQQWKNLSRALEIVLSHFERHNIVVWLEFGTLIGCMREGMVIAWDYDGDVSTYLSNKEQVIKTFQEDKEKGLNGNLIFDVNYYNDSGCGAFYLEDAKDDIIDLVFYTIQGDKMVSAQSSKTLIDYPSNTDYSYPTKVVFPLQERLFLGHRVWIFNDPDAALQLDYEDWRVPPEEFKDYILPKYCQSPILDIPERSANTFSELVGQLNSTTPLIFRNTPLFDMSKENFAELIQKEKEIYGYSSSTTWEYATHSGAELWQQFLDRTLQINIVDSPITDTSSLNSEITNYLDQKLGEHAKLGFGWVLTCSFKKTEFHQDPPFAGGFMRLLQGDKIWWCVVEEDLNYLESKGHTIESLSQLSLIDMLILEDFYLWGKIYVGRIKSGDLLWFPVRCLHKVLTLEDSYGFGGYL